MVSRVAVLLSFVAFASAKDAIDFNCTSTPLSVDYAFIRHYSGVVNCGNLMLESDIGGGKMVPPTVFFTGAEADST